MTLGCRIWPGVSRSTEAPQGIYSHWDSRENLGKISEPLVPYFDQNDQLIQLFIGLESNSLVKIQ